jgi:hypothetical protein
MDAGMDSLSSVALMSMVAKDIDPWCLMFSFKCFLRYHKNHKTQSLNRPSFGLTIAGFMEFGQHLLQSNMAMGCHGKPQPEADAMAPRRISKRHGWDSPGSSRKTHDGSFFQWKVNENNEHNIIVYIYTYIIF